MGRQMLETSISPPSAREANVQLSQLSWGVASDRRDKVQGELDEEVGTRY